MSLNQRITVSFDTVKEMREWTMQAALDFLNFGINPTFKNPPPIPSEGLSPAAKQFHDQFKRPQSTTTETEVRIGEAQGTQNSGGLIATESAPPVQMVDEAPAKVETRGRKPKAAKTADLAADLTTNSKNQNANQNTNQNEIGSLIPTGASPAPAVEVKSPPGTAVSSAVANSPPPTGITQSQLIEALGDVCDKHDMDKGREILSKYGVSKIRELKEPQYAAFLADCGTLAAQPKPQAVTG